MNRRILSINLIIGIILVLFPIVSSPDFSMGISMFSIPPFQRSLMSYLLILVFTPPTFISWPPNFIAIRNISFMPSFAFWPFWIFHFGLKDYQSVEVETFGNSVILLRIGIKNQIDRCQ